MKSSTKKPSTTPQKKEVPQKKTVQDIRKTATILSVQPQTRVHLLHLRAQEWTPLTAFHPPAPYTVFTDVEHAKDCAFRFFRSMDIADHEVVVEFVGSRIRFTNARWPNVQAHIISCYVTR